MSGRCRIIVAAILSLFAAASLASAPLDVMRACAAGAPAGTGLKTLTASCPELESALNALGLDKILFEGWRENLSSHALNDVIDMEGRYSLPRWHGAPDVSAVPGIVQALKNAQGPQAVSWWLALKDWVKRWLENSNSAIAKWIKHALDGVWGPAHVPEALINGFIDAVTLLLALAAAFIVFRELRAAGIFARLRRPQAKPGAANAGASGLPDVNDQAMERDAPAGMLRALVRRLLETGRLSGERSLTHRELIARASFDDEGQQAAFGAVARLAETVMYGSNPAPPDLLQSVARQGRELLQQIHPIETPR